MRSLFKARLTLLPGLLLAACQLYDRPETPAWPEPLVMPGEKLLILTMANGGEAVLKQVGQNGSVATWMSQNHVTISLDRGVVVATRGFVYDVMAGDSAETLNALASGQSAPYSRRLRYLNAEQQSWWLRTECRISPLPAREGPGFREVCTGFSDSYENSYQLDSQGHILSSRQWIGPEIGYLKLHYKDY